MAQNQTSWNGPKFLQLVRDHWPESPQTSALSVNVKNLCHTFSGHNRDRRPFKLSEVNDIEGYSGVTRLSVTTYILWFMHNAKESVSNQETQKSPEQSSRKELSAQELNQAEMLWIKTVQTASFAKELCKEREEHFHPSMSCNLSCSLTTNKSSDVREE